MKAFSLVFLCCCIFIVGYGQHVSRNDSIRYAYEEKYLERLALADTSENISVGLDEEDLENFREFVKTRDDTTLPGLTRMGAQVKLVLRTLYRDTRNSLPELRNYIQLATEYRDSLTNLAHAYSALGYYHQKLENYDSAKIAFQNSMDFAIEKGYMDYVLNARIDLTVLEEKQGNYQLAIAQYLDIIDSCMAHGEPVPEARARINIGNLYHLEGDFVNALDHLSEALDLCLVGNLTGYMASSNIYLGDVNLSIGELRTAENHYTRALLWSDSLNNSGTKRLALIQFTKLRKKQGKIENAIHIARQLILYDIQRDIPDETAEDYYLLAELHQFAGRLDSAETYALKSIRLFDEVDYRDRLYKAYGTAGSIYLELDKVDLAEKYCMLSYKLNKNNRDLDQQRSNCNCLYKVNKQKQNSQKALAFYEEYTRFNNELTNKEKARKVIKEEIHQEYLFNRYRDSLSNTQTIQIMESRNQQRLEKRSILILFLLMGLVLVIVILILLGYGFQRNRKQKRELGELNQLNKQIFSIISHDFRGPLMSMNILLDTLKQADVDHRRMQVYLQDMKHQVAQTGDVLENLLNWARAELQINLEEVPSTNLLQIAEEMNQFFAEKIAEKQLRVSLKVDEATTLEIHPDLLRILLRNLFSNAIKYTPVEGRISLEFDPASGQIVLSDTGIGMTEQEIDRLLKEPVFSKPGTSQESGFGIGLYITAQLIKKIGWNITVESERGKGATFFVQTNK